MPSSAKEYKVFLSLGANIGNPKEALKQTVKALSPLGRDLQVSPLYITKPQGFLNQPDFFNCAVSLFTSLNPAEFLSKIQAIEASLGRVRTFKNAPRLIDIDIVLFGNIIVNNQNLQIPHPAALKREFVLKPLADLDPSFLFPDVKLSVKEALLKLPVAAKTSSCRNTDW